MTRRSANSKFNPRLSAGGANRTNIHGQMNRMNEPESSSSQRPSSTDLMPVPRRSSFQRWNSRLLTAHRRYSPEPPSHWEPAPMLPPRPRFENRPDRIDYLLDEKGRPVPKRGMFLNAKYSEDIRPMADESKIRKTEEMIRRIIRPRRHEREIYTQNNELRNLVRQTVYDLGVPKDYRVPTGFEHHQNHQIRSEFDPRGHPQDFDEMYRWAHGNHKTNDVGDAPAKKRYRIREEEQEEFFANHSNQPGPSERRPPVPEEEEEEEEVQEESMNLSGSKSSRKNEEERAGSAESSPKQHESPKKYIRDPDECDSWRSSLPFMCNPNGAGAAMFSRIGSAIPNLPLKDNTENSYSKVAMMLLSKSIKNMENPQNIRKGSGEGLQTQLLNMSTSWVRKVNTNEERSGEQASVMNEVSKIQNPQNSVIGEESLFRNSELFEPEAFGENVKRKTQKKGQFNPPFHSSPISDAVFRSSGDGLTVPSSIQKDLRLDDSDEEESPMKQRDVDDYIAEGASQLTFPCTPEVFSPRNPSYGSTNQSNRSSEIVEETNMRSQSFNRSIAGNESKSSRSLHFNSRFSFSSAAVPKKKKPSSSQPVLDFDEETQKMFDAVFDNENNKEKLSF